MTRFSTRLYFVALALGIAGASALSWTAFALLDIGEGPGSDDRSLALQQALTYFVPVTFVVLFVLQRVAYRMCRGPGWMFVLSWIYLCAFTYADYAWLTDEIFHFRKSVGTWEGGFVIAPLFGLVLVFFAALLSVVAFTWAKRARAVAAAESAAA